MSNILGLRGPWFRGLKSADPPVSEHNPVATEQYVADHAGGGAVESVNGQTGAVLLGKTDIGLGNVDNTSDANKPVSAPQAAAIATKATDADVLHKAGNESASGIKTFTGDALFSGKQRVAAGFNYVTDASFPALVSGITATATSMVVDDSNGDWQGNMNGTPVALPMLATYDDNGELVTILAVTGAGTDTCTMTIRKGLGALRTSHPAGTVVRPCFGSLEMLSANARPARSVANMNEIHSRFFLPPTSNLVSGLWTKAAAGQVFKIGFTFGSEEQTVDIDVPYSTTGSGTLATLAPDANLKAGIEVWWDDTAFVWNITGSYGGTP